LARFEVPTVTVLNMPDFSDMTPCH